MSTVLCGMYVHRIESGLKSRAESEKEQAINEKDEIAKSCELLRRQMDDKVSYVHTVVKSLFQFLHMINPLQVMLLEQRLLAQDEELRALRSQSDQRLAVIIIDYLFYENVLRTINVHTHHLVVGSSYLERTPHP